MEPKESKNLTNLEAKKLIDLAKANLHKSYAPYSNFNVCAALLATSGEIYVGVNVENCIYRGTHAEKLALDKAVMEGEREFVAIAIVSSSGEFTPPCGQCRQDLAEFDIDGTGSLRIILADSKGRSSIKTLNEYLPDRFSPSHLGIDVTQY